MPLDGNLQARYAQAIKNFQGMPQALKCGPIGTQTQGGCTQMKEEITKNSSLGLSSHSVERLSERLETLAFAPRLEDAPPLTTYRTSSTEHGEVYRATQEYITWLGRKIPGYGELRPVTRAIPSRDPEGSGVEF